MFLPDTNYVKFCFVIIIWYIVVLLHNYIAQVQLFYSYMEFSSFKKKSRTQHQPDVLSHVRGATGARLLGKNLPGNAELEYEYRVYKDFGFDDIYRGGEGAYLIFN